MQPSIYRLFAIIPDMIVGEDLGQAMREELD